MSKKKQEKEKTLSHWLPPSTIPHGRGHVAPQGPASSRLVPPPLSLPARHTSYTVHDLEEGGGDANITKEDYYEQIRKKPIKILMTREISRYYGRETYLKTTIREIIIYALFLIVLSVLILETPADDMHMFISSMADIFTQTEFPAHDNSSVKLSYKDVSTISQLWAYLDKMVDSFQDYYFIESDYKEGQEDMSDRSLYENHLIGLPRMRSVRVRNDSCNVAEEFKDRSLDCFNHFSHAAEDTRKFGPMTGSEWVFSSSEKTGMHSVYGAVSTYCGGGFYKDFPKSAATFRRDLQNLEKENWIDRATRAVIVDLTVYNANVNLFCIIKLLFEMPPTGGVVPSIIIHTLKLIDFSSKKIPMLACLTIFILLFIFYTVEEFYEMIYFRWRYIKSFWNVVDVAIVLTCYLVIATNLFLYVTADATLAMETNDYKFCNFDQILYVQITCNFSISLLVFFSWLKIIKYVNINQNMHQLQAALQLASKDIMWYAIIFLVIFFDFAFTGYLLFGRQLGAFKSTLESAWTLLRAGVGDFDYLPLQQAQPLLGPLFFLLLVFSMSFVFMAMLIAILLDRYREVRSEIYISKAQMKIGDVLQNWLVELIATLSIKMAARTKAALNKRKLRNKFQDVRYLLMRCGFSELEINMFLAKYEISEDRVMTEDDLQNIMQRFNEKGVAGVKMARQIVRQSVMEKLDAVEEALGVAQKKTTLVLNVLQAFENKQTRRMSRLQ